MILLIVLSVILIYTIIAVGVYGHTSQQMHDKGKRISEEASIQFFGGIMTFSKFLRIGAYFCYLMLIYCLLFYQELKK